MFGYCEEEKMIKILREAKKECEYNNDAEYKFSFYNISERNIDTIALFNVASGALATFDSNRIENYSFSDKEIETLVKNGFLVDKKLNEFMNYVFDVEFSKKESINYFTIIPTTKCNAKCFYCYEEDYVKQTMSEDTQLSVVEYLKDNIMKEDSFTLDWYGGEPLLCVNIIDRIIEKLSKKVDLDDKNWDSSITTNAILFDDKLIEHAVKVWHLSTAHITIDGTEEQHNQCKNVMVEGGAYQRTISAISLLLRYGVYVNLRIHLDNNNKGDFSKIISRLSPFFSYKNFHLFPTFLFPPEFEMNERYIVDGEKEKLFYDVYSALKMSGYHSSLLDYFPWPKKQNCFATRGNTILISPDGRLHSCVQEFTDNYALEDDKKFYDYERIYVDCNGCLYFPICLGGCIHNRSISKTVRTPCVRNRYTIKPLLKLLLQSISN